MHARTSQDALRTLTDAAGQRHVPAGPDARIVSLVPSLTELVFDLGLGDRLVGRTGFCVHPREALRGVPKVGGTKDVKLERIRELAPTHVLVNMDENRRETVDALAAFVPDIVVTHPNTPQDNLPLFALLGGVFGVASGPEFYRATARQAPLRAQNAHAPRTSGNPECRHGWFCAKLGHPEAGARGGCHAHPDASPRSSPPIPPCRRAFGQPDLHLSRRTPS